MLTISKYLNVAATQQTDVCEHWNKLKYTASDLKKIKTYISENE